MYTEENVILTGVCVCVEKGTGVWVPTLFCSRCSPIEALQPHVKEFTLNSDTTEVLPNGTVADVKNEVAKRIRDLGPGGGYVLGSVHNMQNDIPPKNILAMFEAAAQFGKYPLNAYITWTWSAHFSKIVVKFPYSFKLCAQFIAGFWGGI